MKRFFELVICLIIVFTMSGCTKNTVDIKIQSFCSTVEIISDELNIKGSLEYAQPYEMSFTVTEPVEIQGIKLDCSNGEIIVTCNDLAVDIDSISCGNDVFSPMFHALNIISTTGVQAADTGINTVNLPSYGINFIFSSDEMKIISIETADVVYNFI